jgi:putative peptidoglycan lipid II flippase
MPIARDVATVGSATLGSRLLGFSRDIGIAALLGAGTFSDAFFAILQIVNFFRRLLAEGALNAAFVPMWLRIKHTNGENGADSFLGHVLGTILLATGALAAIGLSAAPAVVELLAPGFDGERQLVAVEYLRIVAFYVVLAGLTAVAASILNAEGRVGAAACGVLAFNAVLLIAVAGIAAFGTPAQWAVGRAFACAVVVAGIAQLVVTAAGLVGLRPKPVRLRFGFSPSVRRFLALAIPGLVAAGIPQIKLIAGAMIASSSPAALSWLYYANRLYELPLGLVSITVAAVLAPALAASLRGAGQQRMSAAQSMSFEIALGLGLPAALALALLAQPIVATLFERGAFGPQDTAAVAAALGAISVGLPGHILEKVFGAIAFAHEDTRTPMWTGLAALAAAVAGALTLFPRYGHVGVAAAIAGSGWTGAVIIGVILWRRGWLALAPAGQRRLWRIGAAAIAMGLALSGMLDLLAAAFAPGESGLVRVAVLALLIAAGLAVYLAALQALGVARLRELAAALRKTEGR